MIARRLTLAALILLCALVLAFAAGATSAGAVTQFGSQGSHSGDFNLTQGVAVDQASGDVYVADNQNLRVEKFDGSGSFLMAWGWGVNEEHHANELQTCATACQAGQSGGGAGEFQAEGAQGVAVDNELGSLSYGDVYVVDWGNFRVEKFNASGEFLSMFGGGVNEATSGDVCVAGEACRQGAQGTADGQFEWAFRASYIAVGPGGRVYVGDKARVQVFEPSGAWRENVSLAALSATGQVTALAVNASGDMFVKDSEAAGVRELEPNGTEKATQFDAGSTTVQALALDGSGDLFVGDSSGGFHVLQFDSAGKGLASFASNVLTASTGMAFADAPGELYLAGYLEIQGHPLAEPKVWIFTLPALGPLVEPGSVSATPGLRGHATLKATVNPEGRETTYRYEYVDDAHFQTSGYASAQSTPAVSIGPGSEAYFFEDHLAAASLTGLVPGTIYHYRLVASNSKGTATTADQAFTETPPVLVDGPWASDVASTSVTLAARIDPLEASTEYRLEYGTSASYGHVLSGNAGEGSGYVPVSYHLQGLEAHTTYHYRLVVSNEVGSVEGTDHTFTTQLASEELTLPDGRAWELVSPPDKKGAVIEPFSYLIQAATDGSGIAYPAKGPHVGESPESKSVVSTVLSRRGAAGWISTDIDMPRRNVNEGESTFSLDVGVTGEYGLFSPDLSLAVAEPTGTATPPLSSQATERTLYVRNNANGSFLALVTPADVPSGTKFGGEKSIVHSGNLSMRLVTATPDLAHVVFESPLALTPEAVSVFGCGQGKDFGENVCGAQNLYEWGKGRLQLVNILPGGEPTTHEEHGREVDTFVAGEGTYGFGLADRPVSADGRWVVWTWGNPYTGSYLGLYVRDMVGDKTVRLGGPRARYQTMSSDGSRIFFLENGDLYEFDTATGTQSDLTAKHAGEVNAGVQESVSDVSEDGSYVYFVAKGVLAQGGVSGGDNLYLLHEGGGEWTTTYIVTLSHEDENSWYEYAYTLGPNLVGVSSRVSPDGRYLAFMSNRSLTGYDNLDANSGQPDEEVYLYDSVASRLVCASCNPTGARPVGALDSATSKLLVDNNGYWGPAKEVGGSHWLAGSIPGWAYRNFGQALYQPRYLSDSGRVFFNSPDALVAQDTNGLEDVYEYDPAGVGNCTSASVGFSERSRGCVGLISSGTSGSESVFYDASESGDDVFFLTSSRLATTDYDNTFDVYDAHVCSVSLPCAAAPVSPPPCSSGDSCKAAPSPQPEIFGPAPSATFSGTGNVVEEPKKSAVKHKTKPNRHAKHRKRRAKKAKRAKRPTGGASRKGGER